IKTISYQNINKSSVWFYDASLKLTHKFSESDKLTLSGYSSQDIFGLPSDTTFKWMNRVASLQLDHTFSSRAFSTFTLGYGQYAYDVTDKDPNTAYDLKYSLSYPTLKADFNYLIGKHKLNAGVGSIWYGVTPGTIVPTSVKSNVEAQKVADQQSLE